MEINKALFHKLGFKEPKIVLKGIAVAKTKQSTTRELLISLMDAQMKFNWKQEVFNKSIEQLPTIKKELDQIQEQDK